MFYTENNELLIIFINALIIFFGYFFIYPKYAGSNLKKLAFNDLIATFISLVISGSIFWGKETNFNALLFTTNWFWFSILTYLAIELPFMSWYMKKYGIKFE